MILRLFFVFRTVPASILIVFKVAPVFRVVSGAPQICGALERFLHRPYHGGGVEAIKRPSVK